MSTTAVACSQCGLEAPRAPGALAEWRHGELALDVELDEGLLICPDCDADDREGAFEEGEGG